MAPWRGQADQGGVGDKGRKQITEVSKDENLTQEEELRAN